MDIYLILETLNYKVMSKPSRKMYVEHLNRIGASLSDKEFIIRNKMRKNRNKFGKYLRKYAPITFEVGYQDYVRENSKQWKSIKQ